MNPPEYRYTKEHEWVRLEDETAVIGITAHAQEQLGDIVFVELPAVGTQVEQFAKFGEIESVKAVSDLYAPVSGSVVAVNDALAEQPQLVNEEPFTGGWMVKVAVRDRKELEALLTSAQYEELLAQEA